MLRGDGALYLIENSRVAAVLGQIAATKDCTLLRKQESEFLGVPARLSEGCTLGICLIRRLSDKITIGAVILSGRRCEHV